MSLPQLDKLVGSLSSSRSFFFSLFKVLSAFWLCNSEIGASPATGMQLSSCLLLVIMTVLHARVSVVHPKTNRSDVTPTSLPYPDELTNEGTNDGGTNSWPRVFVGRVWCAGVLEPTTACQKKQ